MKTPGSAGEVLLQKKFGTQTRARAFYKAQVRDFLNPAMMEFIGNQTMMWVATSDRRGNCDCTFRAGPKGFVNVVSSHLVAWPEYRGNGVMASLGNISENPHVGLLLIDFLERTVGLHINGKARILEKSEMLTDDDLSNEQWAALYSVSGSVVERWVIVEVEEAYIHCSKHIPLLKKLDKEIDWGTDDVKKKGGDAFRTKSDPSPWTWKDAAVAPFKKVPLLRLLEKGEVKKLLSVGASCSFRKGDVLIRQGERVENFLILRSGAADIYKSETKFASVGEGDFVGEISLISRMPATATVIASEDIEAISISAKAFRSLLREMPSASEKVIEAMAARLS
ncbi:MAG: cyclic nucleotide-binding domain-containing protein [Reyranellaceae bacterium]